MAFILPPKKSAGGQSNFILPGSKGIKSPQKRNITLPRYDSGDSRYQTGGQFSYDPSRMSILTGTDRDVPMSLKTKIRGEDEDFEVDHIVPLWLGGTNAEENLQKLSKKVHGKKTWANDDLENPESVLSRYKAGKLTLNEARMEVLKWQKPKSTLEYFFSPKTIIESNVKVGKWLWDVAFHSITKYVKNTGIRVGEAIATKTKPFKALEEANTKLLQAQQNMMQLAAKAKSEGNSVRAQKLYEQAANMTKGMQTAEDIISPESKVSQLQIAGEALGSTLDLLPFAKGIGFASRATKAVKDASKATQTGVNATKALEFSPKLVASRLGDVAGKMKLAGMSDDAIKAVSSISTKGVNSPVEFYTVVKAALKKAGVSSAKTSVMLKETTKDFGLLIREGQPIFRMSLEQMAKASWKDMGTRFLAAGGEGGLYGAGYGLSHILQHPEASKEQKLFTLIAGTGLGVVTQRVAVALGPKILGKLQKIADKSGADGMKAKPIDVYNEFQETLKTEKVKDPGISETAGGIQVATDNKTLLENWIKSNEKITYRRVNTLPDGVASRFEWDYKNKQGIIYTRDATTASNLAHELGHFFDRDLTDTAQKKLSEIIPDYISNKPEIDSIFASYVVNKYDGKVSSKAIDGEVTKLVNSFQDDMDRLAVAGGEMRTGNGERFAAAFSYIVDNPVEAKRIAPNFSEFIEYNLAKSGLRKVGEKVKYSELYHGADNVVTATKNKEFSNVLKEDSQVALLTKWSKEGDEEATKILSKVWNDKDAEKLLVTKAKAKGYDAIEFSNASRKHAAEILDLRTSKWMTPDAQTAKAYSMRRTVAQVANKEPKLGATTKQIGGTELLKTIRESGVSIPTRIKAEIAKQAFSLETVKIETLLKNDKDLADFVKTFKGKSVKQNGPAIVGDWMKNKNAVMDGWHRIAALYNRGEKTVQAYVSSKSTLLRSAKAPKRAQIETKMAAKGKTTATAKKTPKKAVLEKEARDYVAKKKEKFREDKTELVESIKKRGLLHSVSNPAEGEIRKKSSGRYEAVYAMQTTVDDFSQITKEMAENTSNDVKIVEFKLPSSEFKKVTIDEDIGEKIYGKAAIDEGSIAYFGDVKTEWISKIYDADGKLLWKNPDYKVQAGSSKTLLHYAIGEKTEKFRTATDLDVTEVLTTKVLKRLEGKESVSKQYISDLTNAADLKQVEKDLIRKLLEKEGAKVDVAKFTKDVQAELLPLKIKDSATFSAPNKYEHVTLRDVDERGKVINYAEHVYESPIKNSAGSIHFRGSKAYFGHTRIEDVAGNTRRVIEVQSDLYQKGTPSKFISAIGKARDAGTLQGNYENLISDLVVGDLSKVLNKRELAIRFKDRQDRLGKETAALAQAGAKLDDIVRSLIKEKKLVREDASVFRTIQEENKQFPNLSKKHEKITSKIIEQLEQLPKSENRIFSYSNPTAHFRLIREEVALAAREGKAKLQFPTGETAMKIEGLAGDGGVWTSKPTGIMDAINSSMNPEELVVGKRIFRDGSKNDPWVIIEVTDELVGTFRAVEEGYVKRILKKESVQSVDELDTVSRTIAFLNLYESFSLKRAVDVNDPIYKFYEKEAGRYLKNNYDAKVITDRQGVNWFEVQVKKEYDAPVEAFRVGQQSQYTPTQEAELVKLNKRIFGDTDIRIVKQLMTPEGQRALGSYKSAMIKIVDGSANAKETFFHEAVHKYLDRFTTSDDQVKLLTYARETFSSKSFEEAEEMLAEKFITYAKTRTGFVGEIKRIINKVLLNVKKYIGNEDVIKKFYNEILEKKKIAEVNAPTVLTPREGVRPTTFIPKKEQTRVSSFKGKEITTKSFLNEKMNTSDDALKLLNDVSESNNQFSGERRSTTLSEMKDFAMQYLGDEKLYKSVPAEIRENIGRMKAAQQTMVDMAEDLQAHLKSFDIVSATPKQIEEAKNKLFNLEAVSRSFSGARTEASHLFSSLRSEVLPGENDLMKNLLVELKTKGIESASLKDVIRIKNEVLQPTLKDKAFAVWYASILSGPKTTVRNIVGTGFHLTQEISMKFLNPTAWKEIPTTLRALPRGFKLGLQEAKQVLQGKADLGKFVESGERLRPQPIKGKFGDMLEMVGKFLNAQDRVFFATAREMEDASLRKLRELGKNTLTDEQILLKSKEYAEFVTYRNKPEGVIGALAEATNKMTNKVPATKIIVPFVRTVANVTNRQLDYMPVFALPRVVDAFKNKSTREGSQALAKMLVGTSILGVGLTAGYNNISGKGPKSYAERQTLMDTGWRPNSIKIGDKWYPYTYFGAHAGILSFIGNIHDAVEYNNVEDKELTELVGNGIVGWTTSILDQSFMSGVSNLLELLTGRISASKYFTDLGAGLVPIPALYTQTKDIFFQKEAYRADTLEEKLLLKLGFVESLQPKLDVFGEQVIKDTIYGLSPSQEKYDVISDFVRTHEDVKLAPPDTRMKVYTKDGQKREVTPQEYTEFLLLTGPEIKEKLLKRIESGYFDRHDAAPEVEKIIKEVRDKYKKKLWGDQARNLKKYKRIRD